MLSDFCVERVWRYLNSVLTVFTSRDSFWRRSHHCFWRQRCRACSNENQHQILSTAGFILLKKMLGKGQRSLSRMIFITSWWFHWHLKHVLPWKHHRETWCLFNHSSDLVLFGKAKTSDPIIIYTADDFQRLEVPDFFLRSESTRGEDQLRKDL